MNRFIHFIATFFLMLRLHCQDPRELPQTLNVAAQVFNRTVATEQLEYPPQANRASIALGDQYVQLGSAIDVLLNFNLKMCSTCDSLKYFSIKYGPNNVNTLKYLTVGATCLGLLSFQSPSTSAGRPGTNQQFIATQLQDETWLLQPRNCPGAYIKATSTSTISVVNGLTSNSRFWFLYHDNHVHMKSAYYTGYYWAFGAPLQLSVGASSYTVQFWPPNPWP